MKKVINESVIRNIVRESLLKVLRESSKEDEMSDMYDEFGNNNIHNTNGRESMWAQGDDNDFATHLGRATRSTGSDSLKAAKKDKFFNLDEEDKSYEDKWEEVEDDFFDERGEDPENYDEDYIWDEYGNENRLDNNGLASLAAQGHPKALSTKMARNGNKLDDVDIDDIDLEATFDEADFLSKHTPETFDLNESVRRAVRSTLRNILSK